MTSCDSFFSFSGRVEQSVYALLRTRDMAISRYREFGIPVDWLLDSGVVGKVSSSLSLSFNILKENLRCLISFLLHLISSVC